MKKVMLAVLLACTLATLAQALPPVANNAAYAADYAKVSAKIDTCRAAVARAKGKKTAQIMALNRAVAERAALRAKHAYKAPAKKKK